MCKKVNCVKIFKYIVKLSFHKVKVYAVTEQHHVKCSFSSSLYSLRKLSKSVAFGNYEKSYKPKIQVYVHVIVSHFITLLFETKLSIVKYEASAKHKNASKEQNRKYKTANINSNTFKRNAISEKYLTKIAHFRVVLSLAIKARPGLQPFIRTRI